MSNAEQFSDLMVTEQVITKSTDDMTTLFDAQKRAFNQDRFPAYESRIADLKLLKGAIHNKKEKLLTALEQDFGYRNHNESILGDIFSSLSTIDYTIKHLRGWMKPQKRRVGIVFQPAKAEIHYQPLGVVGIIAPWNYPVFLTIGPLVAAVAAGNRAMIKVSEFTPATNAVLVEMLGSVFSNDKVCVVQGDANIAKSFSELPFDHLLFTGSTQVGRHVMLAAADNLVPITLELGGKSPVIIDNDMPLNEAVKRFIYGKTMNAGQTCVSPDYIYCPQNRVDALVAEISLRYESMYPSELGNDKRTRVINPKQFQRLLGYLEEAANQGATVMHLGRLNIQQDGCFMPLTLVLGAKPSMKVMQEEIFGPILPILGYEDVQSVIDSINSNPRPLGLYVLSFNKNFQHRFLRETHAGGVCINDAAFHVVVDDLPFGGVGDSGIGSYHGVEGFRTFSHSKSVLVRGKLFFSDMLFPPYGKKVHHLFYKFFVGDK
ncbi:coniferyl aldehyde dehydrogenase [Grimontia sp. NTOU-MAR1]|uniref:coniferyl aldehyde dehydrogenase n=1 Tax=Grimontia sp. NTOU-MAR1 TaxID=3111011 RepID=UPI002DBE8ABE|nr:coniferyl aldehyde dehydrogenase [Grimontia sp. NTOU-MAR1]WRV98385.1 coniferyl aldehyde dehydrogenase [Grimontia sp. NTOU-MAR1]